MITPEQIKSIIDEFEEETHAYFKWQLFESEFGGGHTATEEFCKFIANKLNTIL